MYAYTDLFAVTGETHQTVTPYSRTDSECTVLNRASELHGLLGPVVISDPPALASSPSAPCPAVQQTLLVVGTAGMLALPLQFTAAARHFVFATTADGAVYELAQPDGSPVTSGYDDIGNLRLVDPMQGWRMSQLVPLNPTISASDSTAVFAGPDFLIVYRAQAKYYLIDLSAATLAEFSGVAQVTLMEDDQDLLYEPCDLPEDGWTHFGAASRADGKFYIYYRAAGEDAIRYVPLVLFANRSE